MLTELRLENYAVIDNLVVEFGPGLNLLTGETGAGKSILRRSHPCGFAERQTYYQAKPRRPCAGRGPSQPRILTLSSRSDDGL